MKKLIYSFLFGTLTFAFCACGGSSDLKSQNDSLLIVNNQQGEILDDLTETLAEVSASLDSITQEENTLRTMMNEGSTTKQQMLDNIAYFKKMLSENKARMEQLESQLSKRDDQLTKMSKLVRYLTDEIQAKEAVIANLQEQLSQKNADISSLRSEINNLNTTVTSLQEQTASQEQALNTVYYLMGTKVELTDKGILTGGGLTRKKLNTSSIDVNLFTKTDSKSFTTLDIPSKKPQLLPEPPKGSYVLDTKGKSTTLTIIDSNIFWSTSKILVIRVD